MVDSKVRLGVTGSQISDLGGNGALAPILTQLGGAKGGKLAMDYARQMYPDAPEADPWEAALQFFLEMGRGASQPGSTVLGSAVGAMQAPVDYLNAKKKEKTETDRARLQTALQLAPSLKPKGGTYKDPKEYSISMPIKDDEGNITGYETAYTDFLTAKQFDRLQREGARFTSVPKAGKTARMDVIVKGAIDDPKTPLIDERVSTILESDFNSEKHSSMAAYTPKKTNTTIEALKERAELGGLVADTSEYNAFILSGGKIPTKNTTIEALKERAKLGGLAEGTPEYKEFMITGGKTPDGFSLETDGEGGIKFIKGDPGKKRTSGRVEKGYIQKKNSDGTVVQEVVPGSLAFTEVEVQREGFKADIEQANFLLKTVEEIIGRPEGDNQTAIIPDPNLEGVLGSVQGNIPLFLAQGKQDLLVKIDYLKSNAFMQAFKSLKGGGQITEKEGEAATAALARLKRTQSPKEFTKGLTEFANIIRRGREKANRLISTLPKIAGNISGGEGINLDFENMPPSELRLIDVRSLTPEQKNALAIKLGIRKK